MEALFSAVGAGAAGIVVYATLRAVFDRWFHAQVDLPESNDALNAEVALLESYIATSKAAGEVIGRHKIDLAFPDPTADAGGLSDDARYAVAAGLDEASLRARDQIDAETAYLLQLKQCILNTATLRGNAHRTLRAHCLRARPRQGLCKAKALVSEYMEGIKAARTRVAAEMRNRGYKSGIVHDETSGLLQAVPSSDIDASFVSRQKRIALSHVSNGRKAMGDPDPLAGLTAGELRLLGFTGGSFHTDLSSIPPPAFPALTSGSDGDHRALPPPGDLDNEGDVSGGAAGPTRC